ncbi:MAG: hypothetical protein P8Y99_13440 [Calditrichaceae bacterium]
MKHIVLLISFLFIQNMYASEWYQTEGTYSRIEYQQSNKVIADSLLEIAELSIPRLARIFEIPENELKETKIRIILTDAPDVTNGYALSDAVVIYALSSMYMDMTTGTQTWYKQVLKHELAHTLTFIKIKRKLNFLGELANLTVPRWFYEGIAQYYTENWNMYRGDIYIRNAVLSGKLTYSALESLEDGRLLYAAAHGFTRFLADKYGDSCLVKVMAYNEKGWLFDFDEAFNKIYGKSPDKIFTDYIRHMVIYYGDMLAEYPVSKLKEKLLSVGYRTFQVIPLSAKDSTYLAVYQDDNIQNYKTVSIIQYQKGKIHNQKTITNNVNTNVFLNKDRTLAAYGSYYYGFESNQISLKYIWKIYDLNTGKTHTISNPLRARQAVFDEDNNLIVCEVLANQSILHQYECNDNGEEVLFLSELPIGSLACLSDEQLVISVQRKNGYRDLFLLKDSVLTALTNDEEDDRNPVAINDSLIAFNRYIDDNPALAVYNLHTNSINTILNDQFDYWLHGYDEITEKLIVSTWDADRVDEFAMLPLDSIYKKIIQPDTIMKKEMYASWTTKEPDAADLINIPDTTIQNKEIKPVKFPQLDLIHLFSFAIPWYDEELGVGLVGMTGWMEALQRQALAAVFEVHSNQISKSLVMITHNLAAFNSLFSTTYYHGPVIFSHQNGNYLDMYQDIGELSRTKVHYFNGNRRFTSRMTLAYTGYYYTFNEDASLTRNNYGYHGPSMRINFEYLLPTKLYPAIAKRRLALSIKYFKSLNFQYDFGISEVNLNLSSNLFSEYLGFSARLTAINKHGNLPPLKSIGIDRFYEYDFPRDFKYTRPIRGIRKNLYSDRLYWSSTELTYFLSERTGLKLLFLPMNNLTVKGFFDYAALGYRIQNQVYSYGGEVSFGESLYRAGFGIAEGKYMGIKSNKEYYLRLSLYFPGI